MSEYEAFKIVNLLFKECRVESSWRQHMGSVGEANVNL